jgi:hypothetical protein
MFSAPLIFRDKAQCATNGCSISKSCNAVAEHQGNALRVSLSALMDCVVPFEKGAARAGPMSGAQPMSVANALAAANAVGLSCKARLAMNAGKLTEHDNISLKGHQ